MKDLNIVVMGGGAFGSNEKLELRNLEKEVKQYNESHYPFFEQAYYACDCTHKIRSYYRDYHVKLGEGGTDFYEIPEWSPSPPDNFIEALKEGKIRFLAKKYFPIRFKEWKKRKHDFVIRGPKEGHPLVELALEAQALCQQTELIPELALATIPPSSEVVSPQEMMRFYQLIVKCPYHIMGREDYGGMIEKRESIGLTLVAAALARQKGIDIGDDELWI